MSSESASNFKDKMIYRRLGNSGLFVSVLSLGTWVNFGVEVAGKSATDLIRIAYDNGINFFDTAEVYQDGESEIALGKAIRELKIPRSDLVISTKIFWGGADRKNIKANDYGLSRKHIVEGMNAALERLGLDYVDIVFCHRSDPHTPMEETVRAMDHIINKGQAFYWGTSEWAAEDIVRAQLIADRLGLIGPIAEQPQYSMLVRRFEVEYAKLFKENKLGTTIWSPLCGGVLTGKYNNTSRDTLPKESRLAMDRMQWITDLYFGGDKFKMTWEQMLEKVGKIGDIAKDLGATTGQLALAWCLYNNNVSTALVGARNGQQLLENLGALDVLPKLSAEIIDKIEAVLDNKPQQAEDFTRRHQRGLPNTSK